MYPGRHDKVCDSVFLVGGSGLTDPSDCLVYALGLGEVVLIDCGAGASWPRIRENMRSAGLDPDALHTLVLTHGHVDHIGAAARVKKETGCRVVAHEGDAQAIESGDPGFTVSHLYGVDLEPMQIDRIVSAGQDTLAFPTGSLHLLHTPGHTPGSLAVVYEKKGLKVLFGQDIHGPFSPAFGSDLDQWRASMQRLLDLKADILCEGHFGVFQPAARVRKFIEGQLAENKTIME